MKSDDIDRLEEIYVSIKQATELNLDCYQTFLSKLTDYELRISLLEKQQKRERIKKNVYNLTQLIIQSIIPVGMIIIAWIFYKTN
jgi:hypothetical protein